VTPATWPESCHPEVAVSSHKCHGGKHATYHQQGAVFQHALWAGWKAADHQGIWQNCLWDVAGSACWACCPSLALLHAAPLVSMSRQEVHGLLQLSRC